MQVRYIDLISHLEKDKAFFQSISNRGIFVVFGSNNIFQDLANSGCQSVKKITKRHPEKLIALSNAHTEINLVDLTMNGDENPLQSKIDTTRLVGTLQQAREILGLIIALDYTQIDQQLEKSAHWIFELYLKDELQKCQILINQVPDGLTNEAIQLEIQQKIKTFHNKRKVEKDMFVEAKMEAKKDRGIPSSYHFHKAYYFKDIETLLKNQLSHTHSFRSASNENIQSLIETLAAVASSPINIRKRDHRFLRTEEHVKKALKEIKRWCHPASIGLSQMQQQNETLINLVYEQQKLIEQLQLDVKRLKQQNQGVKNDIPINKLKFL